MSQTSTPQAPQSFEDRVREAVAEEAIYRPITRQPLRSVLAHLVTVCAIWVAAWPVTLLIRVLRSLYKIAR